MNIYTALNFDFVNESVNNDSFDETIYAVARDINRMANKTAIDKTDIIYLCLAGIIKNDSTYSLENIEKEIEQITKNSFKKYSLQIDISNFIGPFSLHIQNMIVRCKNQNQIQSNGGLSIKDSCFFIYDIAVDLANEISRRFQININEHEIALISMHIGFAIEEAINQDFNNYKLNILVGLGNYLTLQPFIEKIKSYIPYACTITAFLPSLSVEDLKEYDFLISLNKNVFMPINTCVITPLLTPNDVKEIQDYANHSMENKKKRQFELLFKMYFNEKYFYCNKELNEQYAVLDLLCNELEKDKIVDHRFKSSVFVREAIDSTNIEDKYAIPHAMDFIAKKTMMSIFINPNGIKWNNSTVKIIVLGALNKKNVVYLRIIYDFIIEMLSDPDCFSKLIEARSINEFQSILFSEKKG